MYWLFFLILDPLPGTLTTHITIIGTILANLIVCKNRFRTIIEIFIYIFFVLFQEWICHVNLLPTKNPQVYFIILPRAKWIMEQCCVWPVMWLEGKLSHAFTTLFQQVHMTNKIIKVYIFLEGHKILRNLHLTFVIKYCRQD